MKKHLAYFLILNLFILIMSSFSMNTKVSAGNFELPIKIDAGSLSIPKTAYAAGETAMVEGSFTQTGETGGVVRIDITNHVKLSNGDIINDDTTFPWELVVTDTVKDRIFVTYDSDDNRLDHYFYILQEIGEKTLYSLKVNIPNNLDSKYRDAAFNIQVTFYNMQSSNDAMYLSPGFLANGWEKIGAPDNLSIIPKVNIISSRWYTYTVDVDGSFTLALSNEPGMPTPDASASSTPEPGTPTPDASASSTPEPGTPTPDASASSTPEPGTPTPDVSASSTPEPGTPTPDVSASSTPESGASAHHISTPNPESSPETGDSHYIWAYIVCFMTSVVILIIFIMRKLKYYRI